MIIRLSLEDIVAEIDSILRMDEAARAEVESRYVRTKRRRRYEPRVATTPRMTVSLMEQNINELRLDYQFFGAIAPCLIVGCNNRPIECHQASRRSQLRHIRDRGMVWLFDKYQNRYIGGGGPRVIDERGVAVPQPSKVGAKHATVFKGFCGIHDRELFTAIDNKPLLYTKDQLLRLLYRTFCYEVYWKKWESSPTKQAIDRMSIDRCIAAMWPNDFDGHDSSSEANRARNVVHGALQMQAKDRLLCRELDEWMTWMVQRLSQADDTDVRAIEFRVRGKPFLVCSGLVSARYDFAERKTLGGDIGDRPERYPVAIMTTWLHSTTEWSLLLIEVGAGRQRIGQYVESLKERYGSHRWLERLTTWMMVSCANIAVSPTWWERIGDRNQMICGAILQGHHGDDRRDLTNDYWEEPFVGEADVTVHYHHC